MLCILCFKDGDELLFGKGVRCGYCHFGIESFHKSSHSILPFLHWWLRAWQWTGLSCCQTEPYQYQMPTLGRSLSTVSVGAWRPRRGKTQPLRRRARRSAAKSKTESWRSTATRQTSNCRCPTRQWAPVVATAASLQPPPPSRWFRCYLLLVYI